MTLTRRRFLSISASALCAGASVAPARWSGIALGAHAEITLHGPGGQTALPHAVARLRQIERAFSLYDPESELTHLNRTGRLLPSADFTALTQLADRVHRASDGTFDPSIQPLWQALATGHSGAEARQHVGWHHVRQGESITLAPGQALTFNGIAQGYATDAVADLLDSAGFSRALIDIGEFRALGGPWRIGLEDPSTGMIGTRTLTGGAIATSSPNALMFGEQGHILDPTGLRRAKWSTVSVEADRAALADAVSTACCLLDTTEITALIAKLGGIRAVTLIDDSGNLRKLSAA